METSWEFGGSHGNFVGTLLELGGSHEIVVFICRDSWELCVTLVCVCGSFVRAWLIRACVAHACVANECVSA